MDNAMYVGLSRQQTLRRELDVVSNNVANLDTVGFKFESLMLRREPRATAGPTERAIQFVYDDGLARDFSQGGLRTTGGTFDVGLDGPGFLKVETPAGERYTRDGRLAPSADGTLTNSAGLPILDAAGAKIVVNPTRGQVSIAEDGTISQAGARIGKLAIVSFEDTGALEKAGDNLFRNVANQQPQATPETRVRQGMLEGSNVNGVAQITRLIEVSRAYESISKLMSDTADLSRRSIERMGSVS